MAEMQMPTIIETGKDRDNGWGGTSSGHEDVQAPRYLQNKADPSAGAGTARRSRQAH